MTAGGPILDVAHIDVVFGSARVLKDAHLRIMPGEIHGLVGQNGSGKSTLVKVISGIYTPEPGAEGTVWGKPLSFPVRSAHRSGIVAVHQELGLVAGISALENFGAVQRFGTKPARPIVWRREAALFRKFCDDFGIEIDPRAMIEDLTAGQRAVLAILRGLRQVSESGHQGALILLDEPTVYLPADESAMLFSTLRRFSQQQIGSVIVSHRLTEVLEMSDRITVLRDGVVIETIEGRGASHARLVELVVGRPLPNLYPSLDHQPGPGVAFSVAEASGASVHDVSLTVHEGEITGVTGLVGMGQDELPYLIVGASQGRCLVKIGNGDWGTLDPVRAARAGIVVVPADRQSLGIWREGSGSENLVMRKPEGRAWRVYRHRERNVVANSFRQFDVRPNEPDRKLQFFSGGNQQKIVLARSMRPRPKVLLLHEPTQGVDVGARAEILQIIVDAARSGCSVIIFSANHEELANMCHRVYVLSGGSISTVVSGTDISEARLLRECHAV